ncbi:lysozyme inhibitor LprI family protein [Terrihabitans sp. B22-R8]|uniref:lysozyme inhibitor LprI family protein n=1 Tax=Terrihabitans sp. B22-R8 TaxID=3425128 RepID=UPI00403D0777
MTTRGAWFRALMLGTFLLAPAGSMALAGDAEHEACMEKAGNAAVEMLACLSSGYERADAAMNALWQQLLPGLQSHERDVMREAQQNWIAYRDTTCTAESVLWEQGSATPVAQTYCRLRITVERREWLRNILLPEGGK